MMLTSQALISEEHHEEEPGHGHVH
jgi:hypothetical protein